MTNLQKIWLGLLVGCRLNPLGLLLVAITPALPFLAVFSVVVFLLAPVGCIDPHAQESRIVREVEGYGAGDLTTYDAASLQQWFSQRPQLAAQIATECVWPSQHSPAGWARSAEGSTCLAATASAPAPVPIADQRGW